MHDPFREMGALSVDVGTGYVSAGELCRLAPGDVARTDLRAGHPLAVRFNGTRMVNGELVIIRDILGVRVTRLPAPPVPPPQARHADDLVELLPTEVRVAQVAVTLESLAAVRPGTIISLDTPYSEVEDARLLVYGVEDARGKVVTIEEDMGIRIRSVADIAQVDAAVRSSGYFFEADRLPPHVRDYNFKRPDKFSRELIENMRDIHRGFAANVRTMAGGSVAVEVTDIDQMTFGEAAELLAEAERYLVFVTEVAGGGVRRRRRAGGASLVEPPAPRHPADQASRELIRRYAAGDGNVDEKPLMLAIPASPGWRGVMQGVPENEMVVMLALRIEGEPAAQLRIVYPYIALEPFAPFME